MPLKRKRKKHRYQRGTYISSLAGECKYRSGWEQKFMVYLDSNPEVETWSYEKLIIEYVSNKRTGKIRKYYPDFFVKYKDGRQEVVEIKQKRKLEQSSIKKKAEAAKMWCSHQGMVYKILTELELKDMHVI